jgi:hypothetical protein
LTPDGLSAVGCGDSDPANVSALDSVKYTAELERVGQAVARQIDLADLGDLVTS